MPVTVRLSDGRTVTVNTDDPQVAARAAHTFQQQNPHQAQVDTPTDVGMSAVSGAHEGVAGVIGLPGFGQEVLRQIASPIPYWNARIHGASDAEARRQTEEVLNNARHGAGALPTPESVNNAALAAEPAAVRNVTGHVPQTQAGKFTHSVATMLPNAAIPGSTAARVARVIVPGVASEAAGEVTEGTPVEPYARAAGALTGGIGTEAGIVASERAAARAAAARAPTQANQALEQEFGPMTAGERSGNARAMQEEDDMRRGIGSDRAQRIVQAFDDRRVPEIRQNIMSTATRGQPALSEDVGSAGVTVSDALRNRLESMRETQRGLYEDAFNHAQNERVAPTDELLNNVDATINEHFLDAGPERAIVARLQDEIQRGNATYATVERARQALNRRLASAMKSGDRSAEFATRSIIDEVDRFVAPRLSPEAGRAVTEARGFTQEMLNQLGQRQRTDLSTGHVGRADPGGRAIERVLNTDLTGEQVIDSILGSNKPSAQTLGAVRRIREINDSIAYTNRNSASGVRVPGRQKIGGQTAGERRFAADSPDSRYGVELPNDELQGLREGLFHRILRPLDVRNQGGMIPAQTVVTNLRRALYGPGAEVTRVLFTPNEIGKMERALAYMERLTPPPGTAVSGTAVAVSRMVSAAANRFLNAIPGAGPALSEFMGDLTSTNSARRAVEPGKPSAPRAQRMPTQPSNAAVALATSQGANNDRRPLGAAYGIGQEPQSRRLGQR